MADTRFKKGQTPWNKGLQGRQVSWNKGIKWSKTNIKGKTKFSCQSCSADMFLWPYEIGERKYCSRACRNTAHRTGKHCGPVTLAKMSAARKKNPTLLYGAQNPSWKGGVTTAKKKIRESPEYQLWREQIFRRDDFTCQRCGERGGKLNADHDLPFSVYPALRFELLNGVTLCVQCHALKSKTDWTLYDFRNLTPKYVN